ncbi:WXG100 family type VII secretion target [Krasilnikovia sp. M28-CT-15]|uniref:WXG100 family type VII secretion target n=1 Tax=Krasilnikovia sp. M28-CT-15 TaxID=3373540 RepID=UPI0038769F0B
MPDQFAVDTDRLARTQARLDALFTRMNGVAGTLRARLDAHGNCWGDDAIGRSFEASYQEPHNAINEILPALAEVMRSVGDGVATMAKGFEQTDRNAADSVPIGVPASPQLPPGGEPGPAPGSRGGRR